MTSNNGNVDHIRSEVIELSDALCRMAGIDEIPITFRPSATYGGKAFLTKGYIVIAESELTGNQAHRELTVIHEVCHFLHYYWHKENGNGYRRNSHGEVFKQIEREWLEVFGMKPLYSRAYAHTILDVDGEDGVINPAIFTISME